MIFIIKFTVHFCVISPRTCSPSLLQVDLEMADVTMAEIQELIENLLTHSWPDDLPSVKAPFPSMTYEEAMTTYGVDKPDTRFGWKVRRGWPPYCKQLIVRRT